MEPINSRIIEDHVGVAEMVWLVGPLATLPIEDVNVLAGVENYVQGILVKHTAVEVVVLSVLGTFESCDSILFEERFLMNSCKMASFSLVDFDN